MDLRNLEDGWSAAFPSLGNKSRSGLHARPTNGQVAVRVKGEPSKPLPAKRRGLRDTAVDPAADIYIHHEMAEEEAAEC